MSFSRDINTSVYILQNFKHTAIKITPFRMRLPVTAKMKKIQKRCNYLEMPYFMFFVYLLFCKYVKRCVFSHFRLRQMKMNLPALRRRNCILIIALVCLPFTIFVLITGTGKSFTMAFLIHYNMRSVLKSNEMTGF